MSAKAETRGSKLDTAKLVVALLIVLAGAVAFNYYSDESLLLRVVAMLVVAGVALGIAVTTAQGRTALGFLKDARTEVRKVVWPTRNETLQTTLVVLIFVVLVGILLWIMDSFLLWAVKLLTGQGD